MTQTNREFQTGTAVRLGRRGNAAGDRRQGVLRCRDTEWVWRPRSSKRALPRCATVALAAVGNERSRQLCSELAARTGLKLLVALREAVPEGHWNAHIGYTAQKNRTSTNGGADKFSRWAPTCSNGCFESKPTALQRRLEKQPRGKSLVPRQPNSGPHLHIKAGKSDLSRQLGCPLRAYSVNRRFANVPSMETMTLCGVLC